MDKLMDRLKEPSSWGGLAAVTLGIGEIAKINEAPEIAGAMEKAGEAVASGGSPWTGLVALGAGLLSVFTGEKGGK